MVSVQQVVVLIFGLIARVMDLTVVFVAILSCWMVKVTELLLANVLVFWTVKVIELIVVSVHQVAMLGCGL